MNGAGSAAQNENASRRRTSACAAAAEERFRVLHGLPACISTFLRHSGLRSATVLPFFAPQNNTTAKIFLPSTSRPPPLRPFSGKCRCNSCVRNISYQTYCALLSIAQHLAQHAEACIFCAFRVAFMAASCGRAPCGFRAAFRAGQHR